VVWETSRRSLVKGDAREGSCVGSVSHKVGDAFEAVEKDEGEGKSEKLRFVTGKKGRIHARAGEDASEGGILVRKLVYPRKH